MRGRRLESTPSRSDFGHLEGLIRELLEVRLRSRVTRYDSRAWRRRTRQEVPETNSHVVAHLIARICIVLIRWDEMLDTQKEAQKDQGHDRSVGDEF